MPTNAAASGIGEQETVSPMERKCRGHSDCHQDELDLQELEGRIREP